MKSKLLLVILFSLVCSYVLNAQKNDKTLITGTVVDLDEAPVPDAMIIVDDKEPIHLLILRVIILFRLAFQRQK